MYKKIIDLLGKENCIGFYTEEIRDSETCQRTGFMIKTLSGKQAVLASTFFDSKLKIGKYGVNIEEFEKICLPTLESALDNDKIIIIDEIGPMQMYSERYKELLLRLEKSEKIIVGTIFSDKYDFIDDYKKLMNVDTIELTFENRDVMPQKILKLVSNIKNYNEKIKRKKMKSQKYINELDRFSLDELKITLNSEHGVRKVEYNKNKNFTCTCDFYKEFYTCSHIMAIKELINRVKNDKLYK